MSLDCVSTEAQYGGKEVAKVSSSNVFLTCVALLNVLSDRFS